MNDELYQELIIDHGTNPRNFKPLENCNYKSSGYNPLCGDEITLFLSIANNKIIQANFQGQGCAISMASASIMTETLLDQSMAAALKLFNNFVISITSVENSKLPLKISEVAVKANNLELLEDPEEELISLLPPKISALLSVKKYPSRVKCATLAWHALHAALTKRQI